MSTDNTTSEFPDVTNTIVDKLCGDVHTLPLTSAKRTFTKTVLKQGEGFLRPYMEATCILDIIDKTPENGAENKSEHLERLKIQLGANVELMLGSAETEVARIVEKCVLTMRKGEESEFIVKFVSRGDGNTQGQLMSYVLVLYLHSFSETKPTWSLASDEKYRLALLHKDKGTEYFKDGRIEAAFCQYSTATVYLICISECTSVIDKNDKPQAKSQIEKYKALKCVCYLNLAACQMKVANHKSVITNCTEALKLDKSNVKALYRRAQAYLACGDKKEARTDLKQALKIEPKNGAVSSLLQQCKQ
ncbi:unnamed protein product [Candidula unifasciata]|uniref:BDBT FKBP like N-terminal domain-containing protein n=1 Tax=Candidula unifasciata TaxID=100452 RepID=A0A8S3ZGJ2_9EUPU|nr:unnamed protein product [Candidula unifasciata]